MSQITIQVVSNGYVVFPSDFYSGEKDYFSQSGKTMVFNTVTEIAEWMRVNFKTMDESPYNKE